MLPLQGVLAGLLSMAPSEPVAMAHHDPAAKTHTGHSGHGDHHASAMPDCPMHQPGQPGGSHCNGGCDMCGACSAAMPPLDGLALSPVDRPSRVDLKVSQISEPTYTLYRPPRI